MEPVIDLSLVESSGGNGSEIVHSRAQRKRPRSPSALVEEVDLSREPVTPAETDAAQQLGRQQSDGIEEVRVVAAKTHVHARPTAATVAGPSQRAFVQPPQPPASRAAALRARPTKLWGEISDDEPQPSHPMPRYAPPSARFWSSRQGRDTQAQPGAQGQERGPGQASSSGAPSLTHMPFRPYRPQAPNVRQHTAPSAGSQGGSPDDADAELARKLQEEEDTRVAREMATRLEQEEEMRMQARLNALESMEEESDAHERALASLAALTRRTRSARSPAPALFRGMGPPPPPAAFHGGHGRSGYRTGSGRGSAASSSGRGASSSAGSGFDLGPGAGGWGPMSLSALLLGGGWRGRHRGGGAPPFGGRGVRDMFSSLVGAQLPPHLLFSDRDFTSDDYEALLRLDETVENRKGAGQQDIDTLPTFTVRDAPRAGGSSGDASEQVCSICLEDVQSGALMRVLPCTHKYHQSCIDSWLKQRATCPICQKSI